MKAHDTHKRIYDERAIYYMNINRANTIHNILSRKSWNDNQKYTALMEMYEKFNKLPKASTINHWKLRSHLQINLEIMKCNDFLFTGYDFAKPSIIKFIEEEEYERMRNLFAVLNENLPFSPHLIEFNLLKHNNSHCMIMPHCSGLLANLNFRPEYLVRVYTQISNAVDYLHGIGYAHSDIKPKNILINYLGSFILGDLGSTAHFYEAAKTTDAYVPQIYKRDIQKSHPLLDWAMLTMTLYEFIYGSDALTLNSHNFDIIKEGVLNHDSLTQLMKEDLFNKLNPDIYKA